MENKIVMVPPPEKGELDGKFDAAAFVAEISRIVFVGKSWLAGLVEARRIAREYLPTLNADERQIVLDADRTAMKIMNTSIISMLDSKPLCDAKS